MGNTGGGFTVSLLVLFQLIVPFTDNAPDLTYGSHLSRYSFACPSIYPFAFLPTTPSVHSNFPARTRVQPPRPPLNLPHLLFSAVLCSSRAKDYYDIFVVVVVMCTQWWFITRSSSNWVVGGGLGGHYNRHCFRYVFVRICWAGNPERQQELCFTLPNYVTVLNSGGGSVPLLPHCGRHVISIDEFAKLWIGFRLERWCLALDSKNHF